MIEEVPKEKKPLTEDEVWGTPILQGTDVHAQISRLIAERDLLLFAIAPEDYAKIQAKMVEISETPDSVIPISVLHCANETAKRRGDRIKELEVALRKIDEWELPTHIDKHGQPQSYEWANGSQGAKDYIRNIAHEALKEK